MRTGQVLVTRTGPDGTARRAVVLEVLGVNGGPPFRVRWRDTGHTGLLYPDRDVWTEAPAHPRVPEQRGNRCG